MQSGDDEKVSRLLAKYTPEQLARAYLKASRRARDAEAAFRLLDRLHEAEGAMERGDVDRAVKTLKRAGLGLRAHREAFEG